MDPETFVDVAFTLNGQSLPLDHGYPLFSALSRVVPALHEQPRWGVHPVMGLRAGPDELALTKQSWLKLRMPVSEVGHVLPLAGQTLDVAGHRVSLSVPRLLPLVPAASLKSRFVTVKKFHGDDTALFVDALRRQLAAIDGLGQDQERIEIAVGRRRVLRVAEHRVVGFAVQLIGLEPSTSLAIQRAGLGGRRHMGAGVFVPGPKGRA